MQSESTLSSMSSPVCQTVIVYGSTRAACELLLELQRKNFKPLFLCTNELIQSYFECTNDVQELNALRLKLEDAKITRVMDNRLHGIDYRQADQLFRVTTSQGEFISMCVVICSESDIQKYQKYVHTYRGFFTCLHTRKIPDTLEDVEFHLNVMTDTIRAKFIESDKIIKTQDMQLLTPHAPSRKLCCC